MISILKLSLRNFYRHISRYSVILMALIFVIAVFTVILGIVDGITEGLKDKASRYFAGDLVIQQYDFNERSRLRDPEIIKDLILEYNSEVITISPRSLYLDTGTKLFFNGKYVGQRRVVGVEWKLEHPVLSQFSLVEGSIPDDEDFEGILISSATADMLSIRTGDQILMSLVTVTNQSNTGKFIVRGIFNESSFFGYVSYIHRKALNNLILEPEYHVNEIGLYLKNDRNMARLATALYNDISKLGNTFPPIESRRQRDEYLNMPWEGSKYAIISLDAQLMEITDLLSAITYIAYLIIGAFAIIIAIGVSNTFSILIIDRTKEIGTLRAIGMQKNHILFLFLVESVFLALCGIVIGSFVGLSFLVALNSFFNISSSGLASILLVNGKIPWVLHISSFFIISSIGFFSCVLGSFRVTYKASQKTPIEALRYE